MKKYSWFTLGSITGISRILGLARDMICAYYFGANAQFDAFIVAFQIPNFMRKLFAEGTLSQAFIPIYNEIGAKNKKMFASLVLSNLLLVTGFLVLITNLFGKQIILIYAPGFAIQHVDLILKTNQLLKWTMPYICAISLVTLCAGIQNSHKKFNLTGAIPIILNVVLITAATFSNNNVMIMGHAVFIAGLLQALIMFISSLKYFGRLNFQIKDENITKLVKLMALGIMAAIIGQISSILDTFLASWLEPGSVSWIYYAQRLVFLPIGIIAVAIATVLMPELTIAKNNKTAFNQQLSWGISLIWYIAWPSALGLIILSDDITKLFFLHGNFSSHSAYVTSNIIKALSLGLPAFMLNKVLTTAFYAKKDMQTPMKILSLGLIINIILGIILLSKFEQVGIAIASAGAAWVQTYILAKRLQINFLSLKPIFAAAIMTTLLFIIKTFTIKNHSSIYIISMVALGILSFELTLRILKTSLIEKAKRQL